MPGLANYVVAIHHPWLDGPLELELTSSSEHSAITRAQLTAFHMYQEATMLDADATVLEVHPLPARD